MKHEKRIVEAFRANGIERILVIDDVYDPPASDGGVSGELLDFLESVDGQEACRDAGVADDVLTKGIEAALEGEGGSEDLLTVVEALYGRFVSERDARFDPGGRFEVLKGPTLNILAPLLSLLSGCGGNVEVRLAGIADGEATYREFQPQVVFLDYYLSAEASVPGAGQKQAMVKARQASIDLLARLIKGTTGDDPAVVLMSSESVKKRVEQFRTRVVAQSRNVMALKFRFLEKGWISRDSGGHLNIENEAADTLLDTSQGFVFAQVLQRALVKWRKGASDALEALLREIGGLEPKDFAYLFRFRLATEGERMSDYLEWMFGENLRALVDEHVDWKDESFVRLDDPEISKGIEGAFEGPSAPIARIFHRIRIDDHRSRDRRRGTLGDMYIKPQDRKVRVVITPDCDLVPRANGKTKVDRVLTMGGELRSFEEESASADQFVFRENKPFSLRWNPKDLLTYPVAGPGSLDSIRGLEFSGTLRPLYAQEAQRTALSDLSRIGLAVSPVMGVDATVTAWLRVREGKGSSFLRVPVDGVAMATIMLERGDARTGHKVLLRRSYVHALLDELHKVERSTLHDADAARLVDFLKEKNEDQLVSGLLSKGSLTRDKGPLGSRLTIAAKADTKQDAPWLQMLLELSAEAMEDLINVDPQIAMPEEPAEPASA